MQTYGFNLHPDYVNQISNFLRETTTVEEGRYHSNYYSRGAVYYYQDGELYCLDEENYLMAPPVYLNIWKKADSYPWQRNYVTYNFMLLNEEGFRKDFPYSGVDDILAKIQELWDRDAHLRMIYDGDSPKSKMDCFKIMYIMDYLRAPFVEQLYKTCDRIFVEFLYGNNREEMFKAFRPGKNMSEITRMPNWLWRELVNERASAFEQMRLWYNQSVKQGTPLTINDVKQLKEFLPLLNKQELSKIRWLLKNTVDKDNNPKFTAGKLINYLQRVDVHQAIIPSDAIAILKDYVDMCNKLKLEPIIDSNSLKREHDVTARIFVEWQRKHVKSEQLEGCQKAYEKLSKYEYEDNRLIVVTPKNPEDLINEGRNNRNCVASYLNNYSKGKEEIFFIRKKDSPEKSYITIQTFGGGESVGQAFYACNMPITNPDDNKFINEWVKHNTELNHHEKAQA